MPTTSSTYSDFISVAPEMTYSPTCSDSTSTAPEIVKDRYKSKFASIIFQDLLCELGLQQPQIALFVNNHSILTEEDTHTVGKTYITHISNLSVNEVSLYSYDMSVIDGVLDHIRSTMQRGNIIKEALQCLRTDKHSYLVISSKEIDKNELEPLASFAGAKRAIEPECLKDLEHPCIVVVNEASIKK